MSMCCPCGIEKVLALGLCATCYTLRRQDEEYFGGHREEVLKRDEYRCAVPPCTTLKRGKRSVAVHHRRPGNNDPKWMITLCLSCHAKITRTQFLRWDWPPLLIILWREQRFSDTSFGIFEAFPDTAARNSHDIGPGGSNFLRSGELEEMLAYPAHLYRLDVMFGNSARLFGKKITS
jgi:hypothetical protein